MPERIELPPTLQGDEKNQLQQVWSYLYQLSEAINNNLDAIGGNDLTDKERESMQQILQAAGVTQDGTSTGYETLKSLIIKTADFVQSSLKEYRMKLLGETVASGQFGRYVRQTGLDVEVTPEGITQNYSLREIAEDLKHYEVNAKNYIKTGLLRTVGSIPVYGVAIGKDVVTFSEDGTETYNDGNKVAELTADELSFWQNGVKVAGYTGRKISFYYNGAEAFYIQNGKIYAAVDLELGSGKKIKIGNWTFENSKMVYEKEDETIGFQISKQGSGNNQNAEIRYRYSVGQDWKIGDIIISPAMEITEDGNRVIKWGSFRFGVQIDGNGNEIKFIAPDNTDGIEANLGTQTSKFDRGIVKNLAVENLYVDDDAYGLPFIGHRLKPFGTIFSNNYSANYIYPQVNGNLKQIGGEENPFSKIYATKMYASEFVGPMAIQYDASITDFNDMVIPGVWRVTISNMQHKPSDISYGDLILEVFKITDNFIYQRLTIHWGMYFRHLNSNGWSTWYRVVGTAV